MKHTPGGVWVLVSVLIVIMSSCTPPTQPVTDDSSEQFEQQDNEAPDNKEPQEECKPDEPAPDEPEPWQPKTLHVYTFAASLPRDEWSDETARDVWQFDEGNYHDMLRRVRATIDSHNRNNPGDELQVIGGGL